MDVHYRDNGHPCRTPTGIDSPERFDTSASIGGVHLQVMQQKMQKKLTSHCPRCPSEDDRTATRGLPTTSICWSEKELPTHGKTGENCCRLRHGNQLRQQQNSRLTAPNQCHLINLWMNGKTLEEVKVSKDQTDASTLSKASNTVEK